MQGRLSVDSLKSAGNGPIHSPVSNPIKHKTNQKSKQKQNESHIDASHSRQPSVKGERLVRYEVNAVTTDCLGGAALQLRIGARERRQLIPHVHFQVPFLGRKAN